MNLEELQTACHEASYAAGWWHMPDGLPYIPGDNAFGNTMPWGRLMLREQHLIRHYWPLVLATKIALIHSEVSEGLEALRKDKMDDKLAHRLGLETELADSIIRQMDLAGAIERARKFGVVSVPAEFNIRAAIEEKMSFNVTRPDHTRQARQSTGGKVF